MILPELYPVPQITVPMALEDYLPIVLSGIGLLYLVRVLNRRSHLAGAVALTGTVLIVLGGTFKATWKMLIALGNSPINWLNTSLFVLLSVGYVTVAWAWWRGMNYSVRLRNSPSVWFVPLVLAIIIWSVAGYLGWAMDSRLWFGVLLGVTTVGSLALSGQLIVRAWRWGLVLTVLLFLVNILCFFVLARIADQSVTLQWVKQIISTISQGAFALACWQLARSPRATR